MSEALDRQNLTGGGEPVSHEDLQRMLEESRGQIANLTRERDTERSTRVLTEQERDAERANRVITEQQRDEQAGRVVTEAEARYAAQREAVKSGIAANEGVLSAAEDSYARHAESGDWKAAATAQRQIAEAAAKLTNLRGQQEYLEANKARLVPQAPAPRREQPQQAATTDRLSQLVDGKLEPGEREWLNQRPKFLDDAGYRAQVFSASGVAVAKGYARGSQPYFREIERIIGEEQPRQETQQQQRQERGPSADLPPQRRASPGQNPTGGREWNLTADEAEIADGIYGDPNQSNHIADKGERYKHYWDMKEYQKAKGRM